MRKNKSSLSLHSLYSKSEKSFDKRYMENKLLRAKYPNDVPVIVILVNNNKPISTHKLLVAKDTASERILDIIGTSIGININTSYTNIEKGQTIIPFKNKKDNILLEDLYNEYRDNDGFVYITCDITKKLTTT